jgi:S1-C subfamily serine protease
MTRSYRHARNLRLVRLIFSIVLIMAAGVEAAPPASVIKAQADRIEIIERISQPTLAIFGADSAGGGSGVVITPDGYALTNFHVVQPCGNHMRCGMNDGKMYDAILVSIDPVGDVALIKLVGRDDFPTAVMGDSDQLEAGQTCYVVGNPFVLATDFNPTVTYGIISGVHRYQYPSGTLLEYADCIQTDASINPGNSGGPLFNAAGQLVGINGRASFEKRGRVNVGVGYAISINQIKKFMGHLRSGRIVDHATLGFTVSSDEKGSLLVSNILESGDAYRRGLRFDDEIIGLGGRSVATVNMFKNVLGTYPKGWRIPVVYRRDGQDTEILVRLDGVHSSGQLVAKLEGDQKPPTPMPKPQKKDKAPEAPGPKNPLRAKPKPPKNEIPDAVKELYTKRSGYANYYFNQQNVERIWNRLSRAGAVPRNKGEWSLTGTTADNAKFEITLNDAKVVANLPEIMTLVDMSQELGDQLEPPGSGGMLIALQMWRRFLTEGPAQFGEVYYFGKAPTDRSGQLSDVIIGLYDEFEIRMYFSPGEGTLDLVELYPPGDADPCEIHFQEYKQLDKHQKPSKFRVRIGDATYGTYTIDTFTFPGEDAT